MDEMRNAAIIGAGPAGMAAAIYLQRAGLDPLVLEKKALGGLLRNANLVENYPGFAGGIRGEELVARFAEQVGSLSIEVRKEAVKTVKLVGGAFRIETDAHEDSSRAVIVASGTRPRIPEIPGIRHLSGKKVFSELASMHFDENEYHHTIVLGGGDAAFDYALNLTGRGHRVTILSRSKPRCLPLLRERAAEKGIVVRESVIVEQLEETEKGVTARCRTGAGRERIYGDAVIVAHGRTPELGMLDRSLLRRVRNPENPPETSVPGLYLVGDVVRGEHRQTGIAVGDGIMAAMLLERYVMDTRRRI